MILIVDDDNAVRMALSLALERAGFEPLAVGNEAEALDAVRSGRVELVILDMNLTLSTTGRQGVEVLRKIRILQPDVPVIMITAWGTIPLAVETMNYGAADFVTKPWSNADVIVKIKKALARSSEQRPGLATTRLSKKSRRTLSEKFCGVAAAICRKHPSSSASRASRFTAVSKNSSYEVPNLLHDASGRSGGDNRSRGFLRCR